MAEIVQSEKLASGQSLEICRGDITALPVDAVVNAANSHLAHGGGVAAAISRRGGPAIQEQSDAWVRQHGPVTHAQPAWTSGGSLPCRYVIHAVGPVWGEGDEPRKLAEAIEGSLALAKELKLGSMAFPAISTGIFGFPKELAADIFMERIPAYFAAHPGGSLQKVLIVLYDAPTLQAFSAAFDKRFNQPVKDK